MYDAAASALPTLTPLAVRGVRRAASPAGFTLPTSLHVLLLALVIIGAAMWIGGMTAVTMLAVISKRALEPAARTKLFREFGKTYFPVFGAALVVAGAAGLVMLLARGFDGLAWAIVILVVVILIALAFGVQQARAMGRLRTRAAELTDLAAAGGIATAAGPGAAAGDTAGGDAAPPGAAGGDAPAPKAASGDAQHAAEELARIQRSIDRQARAAAMVRGSLGVLSAAVFVLAVLTAG